MGTLSFCSCRRLCPAVWLVRRGLGQTAPLRCKHSQVRQWHEERCALFSSIHDGVVCPKQGEMRRKYRDEYGFDSWSGEAWQQSDTFCPFAHHKFCGTSQVVGKCAWRDCQLSPENVARPDVICNRPAIHDSEWTFKLNSDATTKETKGKLKKRVLESNNSQRSARGPTPQWANDTVADNDSNPDMQLLLDCFKKKGNENENKFI